MAQKYQLRAQYNRPDCTTAGYEVKRPPAITSPIPAAALALSASLFLGVAAGHVRAGEPASQSSDTNSLSLPPDVDRAANGDDSLDTSLALDGKRPSDWRFSVALYGWLVSIEGDVMAAGVDQDIDISGDDVLDNLDGAFFFYGEARWRKLFAAFDGTWARLDTTESGTLLDLDAQVDIRLFDLRLGYEVFRLDLEGAPPDGHDPWGRQVVVDVFAGARYSSTETTVKTRFFDGSVARFTHDDERWDPFFGTRIKYDLSKHWRIGLRGDVGGFGIGNSAELTWQLEGTIGFRLSPEVSILAGYRAVGVDTVTGSGLSRYGVDLIQHGPFVGLGLSF
ncbi:MAG: hypothetical protein ACYSVY_29075 [Planctomycetota bacterium]